MSVTINGTTGVDTPAVTADSTNVLNLKSEGVTRAYVSASGLTVNRVNSASEGGQLDLCRSTDNASAWAVDVYGSTSTPSLRFVDNIASATRMQIDGSGIITSPIGGVQLLSGTVVASTSGTSIDFTGIPSWAKRITVMFNEISTNGTSHIALQLGTSGGIQNTGYTGNFGYVGAGTAIYFNSSAFGLYNDVAADLRSGALTLSLLNSATGIWTCSGITSWSTRAYTLPTSGSKTLSGVLDRIRITTVNGTDTFDAGSINILYE